MYVCVVSLCVCSGAHGYKNRERGTKPTKDDGYITREVTAPHFTDTSEVVSRTFLRGFHPSPQLIKGCVQGLCSRPLPTSPLGKLNQVWVNRKIAPGQQSAVCDVKLGTCERPVITAGLRQGLLTVRCFL